MAFWNQITIEPKRTFRYFITFGGAMGDTKDAGQISLFATSVDRPKYEVSFKEFQYLNHQFNYPGRVKWQDIKMKFVDAGGSGGKVQIGDKEVDQGNVLDIAKLMMNSLVKGGYTIPEGGVSDLKTLSKVAMNTQVGKINIKILKAQPAATPISATDVVEEWEVYNAMFGSVDFSTLSYENEDFSTVDLTIKYDYAKLVVGLDGINANIFAPA
jgi:hypothetical protein